jgi:signal transduction histidine kinase
VSWVVLSTGMQVVVFSLCVIRNILASLALGIVLILSPAKAQQTTDYILTKSYLEDPTGKMAFEEVQKRSLIPYEGIFTKGFTASVFWIRLELHKPQNADELFLLIRPQYIDDITGFDPDDLTAAQQHVGDRFWPTSNHYESLNYTIKVPIANDRKIYWLRVESTSTMLVDVEAFLFKDMLRTNRNYEFYMGIYTGVLIFLTLWAVLFASLKREQILVLYAAYQISNLIVNFCLYGYFRRWFLGILEPIQIDRITSFSVLTVVFVASIFYYNLFRLNQVKRIFLLGLIGIFILYPYNLFLLFSDKPRTALLINGVLIFVATLNFLLASLTVKHGREMSNVGHMPRQIMIVFFLFMFITLLFTILPTLGLFKAVEFSLYNSAANGLMSGIFMLAILHRRASLLEKNAVDHQHNLSLSTLKIEQERLYHQDQEKLIHILGHELKAPLNVIRVAMHQEPGSTSNRYIKTAVTEMEKVIDRSIQTSRLEDKKMILDIEPCQLAHDIEIMIDGSGQAERIVFEAHQDKEINSDQQLICIILSNLIDNALKYSAKDSVIRLILAPLSDRDGCTITIENEPGDSDWPNPALLFTKFYRNPKSTRMTGSGLGLYLVAGLVEQLNGTIRYRPDDRHVRFELDLPSLL